MQTKAFVVDDDQRTCDMVRTILETSGMTVDCQTNSGGAARRLQAERFDLVLVDVRMPAPDGMALIRLLRSSGVNRRTVVVMMTGDLSRNVMTEGFEAGANFFLFKPVDSSRLLRVVRATESAIYREKRRFQRVPMRCPVTIRSTVGSVRGNTMDLSLGGMLLQMERSVPVGEPIAFEIQLPAADAPVRASGRVVRLHEEGCMGVVFTEMPAAEAERLQGALLPLILRAFEIAQPAD